MKNPPENLPSRSSLRDRQILISKPGYNNRPKGRGIKPNFEMTQKCAQVKKASIIIPVYNERKTIIEILKKVNEEKIGLQKEIIVIDDKSTDGTREILAESSHLYTKILRHEANKGKGAAIRTGLEHASGEVVIIQDADMEYSPSDYKKVIEPIIQGKTKAVYGSRFLKQPLLSRQKWAIPAHFIGNKILSIATTILYLNKISDMETCYKAIRRDTLKEINLEAERFDFEPEITAKLLKKGIKIHEVPITYNPRKKHEGKKINWKDGIRAIWTLIYWRFKN